MDQFGYQTRSRSIAVQDLNPGVCIRSGYPHFWRAVVPRYADWGIVWWVDDYIPMTSEQESRLEQDIRDIRQWHCAAELPRYSEWLTQLKSDVRSGDLGQSTVAHHQEQLLSFFPPLMERPRPAATRLLSSLSDDQVQQLASNMKESQQELGEELLAENPAQTREARLRWSGTRRPR